MPKFSVKRDPTDIHQPRDISGTVSYRGMCRQNKLKIIVQGNIRAISHTATISLYLLQLRGIEQASFLKVFTAAVLATQTTQSRR
jgi:hypothetical protein